MYRHVELLERIILGNSRKECRERKGCARFPSSLSERPSRPLGSRRNYAIVTGGAGVRFRSKCIAKCTPARLECAPQSALETATQDVASPSSARKASVPSDGERRRENTRDFPSLNGGLRVRLDKGKGNQTKRSTSETREPLASTDQS